MSESVGIVEEIKKMLVSYNNVQVHLEDHEDSTQIPVKVTAERRGVAEDLNLICKLRNVDDSDGGYKRERYILKEVLPVFVEMQKYLGIQNGLTAFPKYYGDFSRNGTNVIVEENLKYRGFERVKSLNRNNYKLGLKAIAKFHGLSLALRRLNKQKFEEVLFNVPIVARSSLEKIAQFFDSHLEKLKFNLKLRMRIDLLNKFEDALENFNGNSIITILNNEVENSVLVQGDFHKNSLLVKFGEEQTDVASDITMASFQTFGLHSPIIDLSQYFFGSFGNGAFPHILDFLQFYYEELSSFLKQLGCEAEELFPFNTLLDHWKKYSFYGFCFSVASLELSSSKFEKKALEPRKEDEEIAAALLKNYEVQEVESIAAYRKKLEQIVEEFLNSEIEM